MIPESLGIVETVRRVKSRELSCQELVEHYLQRINEGAELNAFISVFGQGAREQAMDLDRKIEQGTGGRLSGVVLALKDNIVVKDQAATCGSRILENFVSPYDATVVRKLRSEDAIIIGKTNLDEFAMGSSNENSYFGPVKNPHALDRVPGGSSGGSCVAVAADLCTAALGSDTGGSIRQPASFCGVVGLKPTYGRVSRFGLVAFASSLDQIGPVARSVRDAAVLLGVIAGHDERDATSVLRPVTELSKALRGEHKRLRIGLPKEYFHAGLDNEVKAAMVKTRSWLQDAGAELVEVSLPHTEYAIAAYYILATAEASSNLSRYDGARYGFRASEPSDLEDMYVDSRSAGFGQEVKRRIMLGAYVLSAGYYDAYYLKGQKVRTLIKRDFEQAFERCDCLLTPTCPTTAFKIGEKIADPLTMYLSDVFTVSANLAGLPAISVPCAQDSGGLPIGAQIIGKAFDEATVLQAAALIEEANGAQP